MSENLIKSKLSETEFERCECCGMKEDYTVAYIESIRILYAGKFICGLCSEAVKYEIFRCGRRINVDEALTIHMRFCREFLSSPSPTVDFISASGEMFRRRIMDSSRVVNYLCCDGDWWEWKLFACFVRRCVDWNIRFLAANPTENIKKKLENGVRNCC